MKSARERAVDVWFSLPTDAKLAIIHGARGEEEWLEQVAASLEEHARDQRHACAESVVGDPANTASCYGCGKAYGEWPDLLVPDAVWAVINPTSPRRKGGGLLCPNCVVERCEQAGLREVPCAFASGPLRSVEYVAGARMAFLNKLWD